MSELEPTRTYSNRTDIDPATLAKQLRSIIGDGSIGWVMEPIQAGFLRDVADALDENAELRELVRDTLRNMHGCTFHHNCGSCDYDECVYEARARELGIEV